MVANSNVEALEIEGSHLRRDLIAVMDDSNASKELNAEKLLVKQKDEQLATANQKMKNAMAKAVHAFQLTDECNTILFSWYYKGFKLLRRYLVKHSPRTDLKDLDFEAIDKEIEDDKAT